MSAATHSLAFPNDAMILAAGMGERLKPLTESIPKPLLPVANTPVIDRNIAFLKMLGVQRVAVNLFHLPDRLKQHLGHGETRGVKIVLYPEDSLLGTGGGIKAMLPFVQGEHFVCLNGDSIAHANLGAAWEHHVQSDADATMVLTPKQKGLNETTLKIERLAGDFGGPIVELLGKEKPHEKAYECHFLGIHFFKAAFLRAHFNPRMPACITRDGYVEWFTAGHNLQGYVEEVPVLDIGTLKRYLAVNMHILGRETAGGIKLGKHVTLGDDVALKPPVMIGDNVTIGAGSTVGPYVSIGEGSRVAENSHLENTVVLAGSLVDTATLKNQVVLPPA